MGYDNDDDIYNADDDYDIDCGRKNSNDVMLVDALDNKACLFNIFYKKSIVSLTAVSFI